MNVVDRVAVLPFAQCYFCGSDAPIHPDALQHFGEPVCTACFRLESWDRDVARDEDES